MEGQIKVGLRNAFVILIIAFVGIPLLKVAANKATFLPDSVKNWANAV